jgi:diguanylate cyclase (GGDEF)-like protein
MQREGINKILIIDDSIDHIKILIELLGKEYDVFFAKSGKQGLGLLPEIQPDLILLDIIMPDLDGFAVCKEIKKNELWRDIPIIFISAQNDENDEAKGLALGAIDYITKPFRPAIIAARVRVHLQLRAAMKELAKLYSLALDANPVTGLAGNNSISHQIESHLAKGSAVCVVYADIDNFKAFNDKYGFGRGDEVIRFAAEKLKKAVQKSNCDGCFIGHIGGDDFILVVPSHECQLIAEHIIKNFDKGIIHFYNKEDNTNGCIQTTNRQGEIQTFPIMTISLAVVDLSNRRYATFLEVTDTCAEVKKMAKATVGSTICFDRRR